jgi:tagatose-1,6-bisphosphate aldolase non-catalytic subunit AgaZ/GatZ
MRLRFAAPALLAAALAWPVHAQVVPAQDADQADVPLPPMQMAPVAPPVGVRKITDGAMSCEQIYAESRSLEDAVVKHRAASDAAQAEANVAQEAMMKRAAGGSAMPMASGLLGMIPGGGMVSGMAAQAAMSAQMSAMQESTAKMTASYQRMAQAQEQLAWAQARNDHLVGLFLGKNCKLPEGVKP